METNSLNLTSIAYRLANNKWLLNGRTHKILCDDVMKLMEKRAGGLINNITSEPIKLTVTSDNTVSANEDNTMTMNGGNTALVRINGILMKGVSDLECQLLGLCNVDSISKTLDELADDVTITTIIMIFNSPGGETIGIEELGRKILSIDKVKPIYGWSETISCSASYWLMSQCRTIGMTSSSMIGCIGVYLMLISKLDAMTKDGITITPVYSGKYKLLGNEYHNPTDDEISILQNDVDRQHEQFKQTILAKRPNVIPDSMEGLSYEGQDAIKNGLIDIVCDSFKEFLSEIQN